MKNIIGYTAYFLKKVGEPVTTDSNPEMKEQKLELTTKVIPLDLKDSFVEFIKYIGGKVPMEDEFNQWYSNKILSK